MKKWATLLSLLVVVCVAAAVGSQSPAVGKRPAARRTVVAKCSPMPSCTPSTRTGYVAIDDNSILSVSPNPICACVGDNIVWTLDNTSKTLKKKALINDPEDFLDDNGKCKKVTRMNPGEHKDADCTVLKVKNKAYKYEIIGSNYQDPEVEVQGGDSKRGSPSPSPTVTPSP